MYFQGNLSEDCINDPRDVISDRSEEAEFELLSDWSTGEDVGRADKFKDESGHPLSESFQSWLRPLCWGGEVEAILSSQDIPDITQLFSGKIPLTFHPIHPFEDNNPKSLIHLFQELDVVSGIYVSTDSLVTSFKSLDEHRRFLLQYHELFLYYPQFAVQDRDIRIHMQNYLDAYKHLCQQLTQVCRRLQEQYPNAVEQAIAQLLALDTISLRIVQPDQSPKTIILLTSLHPLHLWKWIELSEYLSNISRPLTTKENERVRQATKRLPTILNTFLIHPAMYNNLPSQTETRLVLAGELNNPDNESTIGIPYYQPIAEQLIGADGIQQFASFIRHFLILYPPAQLGLSIVLIDPPRLAPLLKELVDFSHYSEREVHLEGAKVFIFWTEASSYDEWQGRDEDTLQQFRDDPRWMLYIDLEIRTLKQIHEELSARNVQPHITLLCDPSDAVACSTFRTVQDDATPFGVPIQVIYDQIVDKPQVIPAATGGIFDAQSDLRHILSGDLNRTILGVGSRGVQLEDLERFLSKDPATHWLAIIDRPQGTLELPASLGRRLLRFAAGSRYLIIHTTEIDWESYWQKQIKYKLNDWRLSADSTQILNGMLELVPLLSNGMLDLIQNSPTNYANVLNEFKVAEMLGVMAILNWYRQDSTGSILLPIGGQDFEDWYGEIGFKDLKPPYYLGMWVEKNRLMVDIISVHTTNPAFPTSLPGNEFDHLALFAQALEPLFDESESHFILTPIRRAQLRERIIASVFSPSESGDDLLVAQNKHAKAQWAKVINELFGSSYKPTVRLLRINVDFEEKHASATINRVHDKLIDRYDCFQVSIPGVLLTPTPNLTTPTILPNQPEPVTDKLNERDNKLITETSTTTVPPTELVEFVSGQAARLHRVLDAYGLAIAEVDVSKSQIGPRFIRYWLRLLPPSGRLSEVQKYAEDIAREMGSRTVPFIDNIPGERYVGIDLARDEPVSIPLRPALEKLPKSQSDQLLFAAGQNPVGEDLQFDLVKLPHMLVAGQTGSGKTVFLSSLIASLAWRHGADDLQLMLVDPKQMDFGIFETLPHLQDNRIYYEPDDAIEALRYLVNIERPRRTELIRQANCPNNLEYNRRFPDKRLPWQVVVIDEFADLILSLSKREQDDFEKQINRLAATGRAAGIHLIIATQRPTTDVITGTIKANITARVSFRLPSQVDSRTILDRTGAENLLGQGDMLVSINNEVQRLQGYYASFSDFQNLINRIVGVL
jgi:hypothetical protein